MRTSTSVFFVLPIIIIFFSLSLSLSLSLSRTLCLLSSRSTRGGRNLASFSTVIAEQLAMWQKARDEAAAVAAEQAAAEEAPEE